MDYVMIDRNGTKHDDIPESLMPRLKKKGWQLVGENGSELKVQPVQDVAEFLKKEPVIEEKKSAAGAENGETTEPETIEAETKEKVTEKSKPGRKAKK